MPTATHQQHHNVLKFVFGGEIFTKIVAQFDLFVMQRRIDYTMVVAVCVCVRLLPNTTSCLPKKEKRRATQQQQTIIPYVVTLTSKTDCDGRIRYRHGREKEEADCVSALLTRQVNARMCNGHL